MPGRYEDRNVAVNNEELYKNVFKKRGINFIRQFRTAKLRYPSAEEIADLEEVAHTWGLGDRLYKLAYEYYGDVELWWVIAHYNQTPTESHISTGQTIYIPHPIEDVLRLLGY